MNIDVVWQWQGSTMMNVEKWNLHCSAGRCSLYHTVPPYWSTILFHHTGPSYWSIILVHHTGPSYWSIILVQHTIRIHKVLSNSGWLDTSARFSSIDHPLYYHAYKRRDCKYRKHCYNSSKNVKLVGYIVWYCIMTNIQLYTDGYTIVFLTQY